MRYADEYGFYELNPFPGCNQIVISNHSFVYPEHRGKGIGTKAHANRLAEIKRLGYSYVICTVKKNNLPQLKILAKFNWKELDFFFNMETGNDVVLYGKSIS